MKRPYDTAASKLVHASGVKITALSQRLSRQFRAQWSVVRLTYCLHIPPVALSINAISQNGCHHIVPCQNDCALKIGNDCSIKLLGIEAFKNLRAPDTSNSADKPNKD